MDDKNKALWLPAGSIRGIVLLLFVVTICIGAFMKIEVPEIVEQLALMVIGFYFGSKREG